MSCARVLGSDFPHETAELLLVVRVHVLAELAYEVVGACQRNTAFVRARGQYSNLL